MCGVIHLLTGNQVLIVYRLTICEYKQIIVCYMVECAVHIQFVTYFLYTYMYTQNNHVFGLRNSPEYVNDLIVTTTGDKVCYTDNLGSVKNIFKKRR